MTAASTRRGSRLFAEFLGTCLLVATVVGSGIMADRLAAGNIAVALLANTLATAAALVVLIALLGPISGAHFNPWVTLAERAGGRLTTADTGSYIVLQVLGGLCGTVLANVMFDLPAISASTHVRTGLGNWLGEFVATAGLLIAVRGVSRPNAVPAPFLIAAWITAAYWFTASTSFANLAVTIARACTDTFAGIRPADVPGFAVAQLLGATAGVGAARVLWPDTGD